MEHTGFPSDETLAAFLDGGLDPETRRRVIEHMTTCDECYSVVASGGGGAHKDVHAPVATTAPQVSRAIRSTYALAAAAAAVIVGSGLFLRTLHVPTNTLQRDSPMRQLAAATPPQRRIEGRLTGFPYRPLEPAMRGGGDLGKDPDYFETYGIAGRLANAVKASATPENLHAAGVSLLVLGEWNDAVKTLESALQTATGQADLAKVIDKATDASLLSDLSAAYHARAAQLNIPTDNLLALQTIQRAWTLRHLPEIAWNRAIALEALEMRSDAEAAWRDYLKIEPLSPWRSEVNRRLWTLRTPTTAERWKKSSILLDHLPKVHDASSADTLISSFPQQSRSFAEDSIETDHASRDHTEVIAEALARRGDETSRELLQGVQSLPPDTRRKFFDGLKAYKAERYEESVDKLTSLIATTSSSAHMPQIWATFTIARAEYNRFAIDHCVAALARLEAYPFFNPRRFPSLDARVHWLRGLAFFAQGYETRAISEFGKAARTFTSLDEIENFGAVSGFTAEAYDALGASDAWRERAIALEALSISGSDRRLHVALQEAIQAALKSPLYTAFADVASARLLSVAKATESTDLLADAWVWRALSLSSNGRLRESLVAIETAASVTANIDQSLLPRSRAKTDWALAVVLENIDKHAAIEAATRALRHGDEPGFRFREAQLHALRGDLWRDLGDLRSAELDYRAGIEVVEVERHALKSEHLRIDFLDVSRSLYESLAQLMLRTGSVMSGLAAVEDYRGRVLVETVRGRTAQRQTLDDLISHTLPSDYAILEYLVLADRTCVWVIRRRQVYAVTIAVDREQLHATADAFISRVKTNAESTADGALLYDTLVRPVKGYLGGATSIGIVADSTLDRIPFAALFDRDADKYLIEQYEIAYGPSATVGLLLSASSKPPLYDSVAIVANEAFGGRKSALSGVRGEVRAIMRLYRRSKDVSLGHRQLIELFGTGDVNVVHFATHTFELGDSKAPALLVSGSGSERRDLLSEEDIEAWRLKGRPLVVLAGCDTAEGERSVSEGPLGLARAFLHAGASSVIATLQPISDRAAAVMFISFHGYLARGISARAALQRAQLDLLHSQDPELKRPSSWSNTILVGAWSL